MELLERVYQEFLKNGIQLIQNHHAGFSTREPYSQFIEGSKEIHIDYTYRHNGTPENVTVTIKIYKLGKKTSEYSGLIEKYQKVKVPKNASDKVISKRVTEAIQICNAM